MDFFGREKELEILRREEELSASSARFTIVMADAASAKPV